jgi:diguanylate cyclase
VRAAWRRESARPFASKSLKVTVSLGLSQLAAGDDVAKLIRRADDALYKSKEAGRNCGHWNTGETFVPITAAAEVSAEAAPVTKPPATGPTEERPASAAAPLLTEQRTATGTNFIHMLKRRVAESHRFGIPLSILHVKIEDYENVARNQGKAIARQMSDTAAPVLEKVLREMDVLATLDNGEFVAMLPGNTQAEAGQIAKRMRITMNSCSVPMVDCELHVRIRHSVAELGPKETASGLLARAKQGLLGGAGGKALGRSPVDA